MSFANLVADDEELRSFAFAAMDCNIVQSKASQEAFRMAIYDYIVRDWSLVSIAGPACGPCRDG